MAVDSSRSNQVFDKGYNERLFNGRGLRSYYHHARFNWAKQQVAKLGLRDARMIELGCFDGRLFDEVKDRVSDYVGLDANWENGLDIARAKFAGRSDVTLIEATDPSAIERFPDGHFQVAAALETLEHVPPEMVEPYLDELARVTKGHLLVSVPNELGPVFAAKYAAKRLLYGDVQHYSWKELVAATLRRSDLVERDDHKGFDYRVLIGQIARRFKVKSVEGLPNMGLPAALSATVGILASNV